MSAIPAAARDAARAAVIAAFRANIINPASGISAEERGAQYADAALNAAWPDQPKPLGWTVIHHTSGEPEIWPAGGPVLTYDDAHRMLALAIEAGAHAPQIVVLTLETPREPSVES